ncbi:MAG: hypothetical protein RQ729_01735 [Wenzhouxiangellaceae bacterium]|nr:hypothetical protein [Wenzhouxiangellaceae bacterium]
MNPLTLRPVFVALVLLWLAPLPGAAAAEIIELEQRPEIALEHQRMPGNARAQAERRGIIRSAPQLFVYHRDARHTPAFYMQGFRRGFERQLRMMLADFREQRSMVPLERLLENAHRPDGETIGVDALPPQQLVMVWYVEPDCGSCQALEDALASWLDENPQFPAVKIRIALP